MIHGAPFETLQVQPINVVTETVLLSTPGPCVALLDESWKLHAAPLRHREGQPATVTVPVRKSAVAFDCAPNITTPLFVKFGPFRIVNHGVAVLAVHTQPVSVFKLTALFTAVETSVTLFEFNE